MEFIFELAQPKDDPAIRHLLATSAMPGDITVTFEREPNYFLGCATMGHFWQVLLARHAPSGELAGIACRASRPHFVNGQIQDLGYIGQIRIAEKYRGLWLLSSGLGFFRQLHADGRVPAYLGVIADENAIARGVLVERARRNFPAARQVARIYTLGIILRKSQSTLPQVINRREDPPHDLEAIVAFMHKHGAARQFFPAYTKDDFTGPATRGFDLQDFVIAYKDGEIAGVLGLWDQSGYKQSVVQAYKRSLRLARPFYNIGARLLGIQPLPAPGGHIHSAYTSFICIADNAPRIFGALLQKVYALAAQRGYAYLMLGLAENDPLLPVAKKYPHIPYHSTAYLAYWDEGKELAEKIDGRVPYIEIATL
jgi:hypothetical protein